jgi:hypothetical protein
MEITHELETPLSPAGLVDHAPGEVGVLAISFDAAGR